MSSYRADPTRPDKAKAIAAVIGVYAALIAAVILMPADSPLNLGDPEPTVMIDVKEPPKPPPPPPEQQRGRTEAEEGAAGKKANPTPVVAPKPPIQVPATPPIAAAPIAGSGSASTAGAATSGTGPGAGGSGFGRGGGGSGGDGGGIGSDARLLGGNSAKLPSHLLRPFLADRGFGYLLLTVADSGRVTDCSVLQTTGQGPVDEALCDIMIKRSRWEPARDRDGNAVTATVRYTATWKKN